MEPYERVMAVINHRTTDQPPIDYLATPEVNTELKRYLKMDDDEALREFLGVDIRYVSPRYVGPKDMVGAPGVNAAGKDFWGVVWKPVNYKFGTYNEIAFSPLAHMTTVKEVENYAWPSVDGFDFSHFKEEIARLNADRRYAIIYFAGLSKRHGTCGGWNDF